MSSWLDRLFGPELPSSDIATDPATRAFILDATAAYRGDPAAAARVVRALARKAKSAREKRAK